MPLLKMPPSFRVRAHCLFRSRCEPLWLRLTVLAKLRVLFVIVGRCRTFRIDSTLSWCFIACKAQSLARSIERRQLETNCASLGKRKGCLYVQDPALSDLEVGCNGTSSRREELEKNLFYRAFR